MELRSDPEIEAAEQQESGLSEEEARYADQRAFGSMTLVKEEVREIWGWAAVELQDLRFTARALRKSPGVSIAAVLTLTSESAQIRRSSAIVNRLLS